MRKLPLSASGELPIIRCRLRSLMSLQPGSPTGEYDHQGSQFDQRPHRLEGDDSPGGPRLTGR
jgi:hypothetical protein